MIHSEPSMEWQNEIHHRMLSESRTAFAELCEAVLDHLVDHLVQSGITNDEQLCETVATDTLLLYEQNPKRYDPERGLGLVGYLRMDARGDLKNAADKVERRQRKTISIDDPDIADRIAGRNNIQEERELNEWVEAITGQDVNAIIEDLRNELSETEIEIIHLWIIENVRETEPYADLLQIAHKPIEVQRREVKNAKDRLKKKLTRFGKRRKRD